MNCTIEQRIKKNFPHTKNNCFLGGYLLTDGTNVDIRGQGADHRIIAGVFNTTYERHQSGTGWYGVFGMLQRGHMRTTPECNGFEFMKQPTQAQFEAIKEFVEENGCAERCYFERMDSHQNTHYIGDFEDFVRYLKRTYGEYAYW